MKITKRQLRKIISEIITSRKKPHKVNRTASMSDGGYSGGYDDYYGYGGYYDYDDDDDYDDGDNGDNGDNGDGGD